MRNRSIDIIKGLAILLVYLDHSIIYHPIDLKNMYPWCLVLWDFITSFNMPLFFLISGYLFSLSNKKSFVLYKTKILRLLIPYLFTMFIVVIGKLVLPASMVKLPKGGGVLAIANDVLLHGGDRWFVYVLFVMTFLLIPIRSTLNNKHIRLFMYVICFFLVLYINMPSVFMVNSAVRFMPFFIMGYAMKAHYEDIRNFCLQYKWFIFSVFLLTNIGLVEVLKEFNFIWLYILPFIGCTAYVTIGWLIDKVDTGEKESVVIIRVLTWCGRYSLQLYLFSFLYPIIRMLPSKVFNIENPFFIIPFVFFMQLVCVICIIEITKRIKMLRIPCGY